MSIYNNIHAEVSMGSGEGNVYAALPLPCEDREVVFDRPSAQVK